MKGEAARNRCEPSMLSSRKTLHVLAQASSEDAIPHTRVRINAHNSTHLIARVDELVRCI